MQDCLHLLNVHSKILLDGFDSSQGPFPGTLFVELGHFPQLHRKTQRLCLRHVQHVWFDASRL